MSIAVGQKTLTKEKIEQAVNKCFGNGEDFYLLKVSGKSYILLTPFLTQKNEYIELGIDIIAKKRIFITDFGKIKKAIEKVSKNIQVQDLKYSERIKKILKECFTGDIKMESSLPSIGFDVLKLISLLQKIYDLEILLKIEKKPRFEELLDSAFLKLKRLSS